MLLIFIGGSQLRILELTARRGFTNIINWICTDTRTQCCIFKGCPVAWACYTDHVEIAKLLVSYGANDHAMDNTFFWNSPVIIRIGDVGAINSLKWLVEERGHNINATTLDGFGIIEIIKITSKMMIDDYGLNEEIDLVSLKICLDYAIEKGAIANDIVRRVIATLNSANTLNEIEHILKTLKNVSAKETIEKDWVKFIELGTAEIVIKVMSRYETNPSINTLACECLCNLGVRANEMQAQVLSQAGICETFLKVLKLHITVEATVLAALNGIVIMSVGSGNRTTDISKKLLKMDVMIIVLQVMKLHSMYPSKVNNYGCSAVFNLTSLPEGLKVFNQLGIDAYMTIVSTLFWFKDYPKDKIVAGNALNILSDFIIKDQTILNVINNPISRVYEGIITVMKFQIKCPLVQGRGLVLVNHIMINNSAGAGLFGHHGICEIIINTMKNLQYDQKLAENLCGSISNLSLDDIDNRNRFMMGRIDVLLIVCIRRYNHSLGAVMMGLGAIRNLAIDGTNRVKLGQTGACEIVIDMMRKYTSQLEIVRTGIQAMIHLIVEVLANKIKMKTLGAIPLLELAIQQHPSTKQDAQQALQLISN